MGKAAAKAPRNKRAESRLCGIGGTSFVGYNARVNSRVRIQQRRLVGMCAGFRTTT